MDTHVPDWHLLRAFLAVVREGSLSGAARTLATTQPTMGRQIAALETSLGVKLFTRSIDGLSPTEAGLRLIPSAEAMAAAAETAWRLASGKADEARGTVRITASEVIGGEVLPPILAGFHALYPQITVELVLSNRNEDLLRGDADVAVRMVRPSQVALVAKRIGKIDAGLYAHQHYLKAHPIPLCLHDLHQHALIGYDRNPAHSRMIEMMGVPLTHAMFAFRSDSDLAQLAALRAGFGIGASQLGIAKRDRNLVPILHNELLFSMDVWVAIHPDMRNDRRIRLMFDYLVRELTHYARTSHHKV
ncbi:MAG: LysR family transcriptional regulator [Acetobacter papayae]|uniref:LysR family transcriptional regulator n=1 Tax=Acetobacter papayae TaxID=1076592 RepID=UPI0039E9DCA8